MVLIYDSRPSSPKSRIACGVLATGYNLRVALLTPTSVACALSNTDANNSNTLLYSSSVTGAGLAACNVEKNPSMAAGFITTCGVPCNLGQMAQFAQRH